jgi:hypothetical protein
VTTGSDNPYPKILVVEGTAPASPAAGRQALFVDTADHHLKRKNSGGTVTDLEAGGGSAITVDDEGTPLTTAATTLDFVGAGVTASGTGATKTITIPGGGGFTHTYLGYNTAGASNEAMATDKVYAKKVTVATAGIVTSIGAYVDHDPAAVDDSVADMSCAIYSDASGTPDNLIFVVSNTALSSMLDDTSGAGGDGVARWFHTACGMYLTAADYWIAVKVHTNSNSSRRIFYDGSGSDRTYVSGGDWFTDWGWYSPTTTANKYSIRASIIT